MLAFCETTMDDLETLRAAVKKLSSRAITAKMNLHDLSEELPTGWERIPAVAQAAHDAYRELLTAKAALAQAGG